MTTGNDSAQPLPEDQPQPVNPEAAAAAPQAPAAEAPAIDSDDPDVIEWEAAKRAVKATESAPGAETPTDAATGTQPPAPAAAAAPTDQPAPQPGQPPAAPAPMIPKARLDEVLSDRDKALQDAAYWRGRAEAGQPATGQPGQPQPQPAQQTPEQRLGAIQSQVDELANRFDAGELTMAEFKKQERALQTQEQAIREEALLSKVQHKGPPQGGDDFGLAAATQELEEAHPWVDVYEKVGSKADWDHLKTTAIDSLIAKGVDVGVDNAHTRYALRAEMAALADQFGPALLSHRAQAKGIALPGQPPAPPPAPAQQQQPRLAPHQQALANKLALQERAPVSLGSMNGARGNDPGTISEAQLDAMSDDEVLANLPAATRQKLRGVT